MSSVPASDSKLSPQDNPKFIARAVSTEGILAVEGLQKSYGSRKVVKDVSLLVRKGEVVGLLGPNGAGKTTSFYCRFTVGRA
jgi:ABC-type transporter Mla maintaining outer membrane lipid asymmetry ATPase subunit MlaF